MSTPNKPTTTRTDHPETEGHNHASLTAVSGVLSVRSMIEAMTMPHNTNSTAHGVIVVYEQDTTTLTAIADGEVK